MTCHVLVDFDGTIASIDTTDAVLERFALPGWEDVENEWKAGRIGSRECMVRQIALLRVEPAIYDRFLDTVPFDPAFPAFVALARGAGLPITVVSDGLDRNVWRVLGRAGLGDLPIKANRLEWQGDDRWKIAFPHSRSDCAALAGNCKCQFADLDAPQARIMIGDGRSDFCVAGRVDLVLAKGSLIDHCMRNNIPHVPFQSFEQASDILTQWMAERERAQTLSQGEK